LSWDFPYLKKYWGSVNKLLEAASAHAEVARTGSAEMAGYVT
jgi:hypothetical protein